jgi:hypothetical protein
MGFIASFLGAFYYYGVRVGATGEFGQNTMATLAQESSWDEIEFHGRLFQVWLKGGDTPVLWAPRRVWLYTAPPGTPTKPIDLRPYSHPQSLMLRYWDPSAESADAKLLVKTFKVLLVLGLSALALVGFRTWKESRSYAVAARGQAPQGRLGRLMPAMPSEQAATASRESGHDHRA